jgi:SecD/SecF fusion protein
MSGRLWKWIFVITLVVFALYAAYPPVRTPILKERIVEKIAETPEEADQHKVELGQTYVAERTVIMRRSLPLAMGSETTETELVGRREDGAAIKEVTTYKEGRIKLGLDIAGGTELLYELKGREGQSVSPKVEDTIKTLSQRIDPQNVKEFRIQPFGEHRVLIQVPKASREEVERLKQRLMKMGRLEFKLALPPDTNADKYAAAKRGERVPGYVKMHEENDPTLPFYLVREGEAAITGEYLESTYPTQDDTGRPAVGFTFNVPGRKKFALITERNRGWLLAIILDGTLKSAPIIEERIAGSGIIRGRFTRAEVDDLIAVLRAGSLSVDLELLQESTVGPQLGRDSIQTGIMATAVAGALVILFMAVYYLMCGVVADIALAMNLVFLMGVLGLLGATLTLPGIAGIALTLGMAVDANVLIFERIREETALGKAPHTALRNGYDRAYLVIFDSNVTTILTAAILYIVGTGPVRGFAVTLMAGIALSMFTALYVTRLVQETLLDRGWIKSFKMLSLVRNPSLRYTKWRKVGFVLSGVTIVIGVAAFVWRGSKLYDVDFTGGSLVHLSLGRPTPTADVRKRLAEGGFPRAEVQGIQTDAAVAGKFTDFSIRIKGTGVDDVEKTIKPRIVKAIADAGLQQDGDVIVGADAQSLVVKLKAPVSEMVLRQALAGKNGDPFNLPDVGKIEPPKGAKGRKFALKPLDRLMQLNEAETWAREMAVFNAVGLRREACRVSLGLVKPGRTPEEPAELELTTDRPIQWQLLAVELPRLEFPAVEVAPLSEPSNSFTLRGREAALAQLKAEMPSELRLPAVRFDGVTIEAETQNPVLEGDLHGLADKHGLGQVTIVTLDCEAKSYTLSVSQQRMREEIERLFSDLAESAVSVEFEPVQGAPDEDGSANVTLKLSKPLTLAEIQYYLAEAGLERQLHDMVSGGLPAGGRTSELTLKLPAEQRDEIQKSIAAAFGQTHPVKKVVTIGAVVAKELKGRAVLALLCASVVIIFYVALRFHAFRFGVAAVVALIHDLLITAGMVAIADWSGAFGDVKLNLSMLAAFLTILGYSLNDTIVVFDRIRENMVTAGKRFISSDLIDNSINQVLSRTLLTSLTTLFVVIVLYFMGGSVLQGLAYTLIIGIVVGTYSSVFIASPILLDWESIIKGTNIALKALFVPFWGPFWLMRALKGGRGKQ